jgi:hypothetical protein
VRLGGGQEAGDAPEAVAELERLLEPVEVGDEHGYLDLVGKPRSCQQLARVRQLRHDLGANERGQLDARQAAAPQQLDEVELVAGRDPLGLVLEAVAGADLADPHALRQLAHESSARAITSCWISSVPSPIVRIFASR